AIAMSSAPRAGGGVSSRKRFVESSDAKTWSRSMRRAVAGFKAPRIPSASSRSADGVGVVVMDACDMLDASRRRILLPSGAAETGLRAVQHTADVAAVRIDDQRRDACGEHEEALFLRPAHERDEDDGE